MRISSGAFSLSYIQGKVNGVRKNEERGEKMCFREFSNFPEYFEVLV
jgi:hypothetical protein